MTIYGKVRVKKKPQKQIFTNGKKVKPAIFFGKVQATVKENTWTAA
jgi:hypothetical protein